MKDKDKDLIELERILKIGQLENKSIEDILSKNVKFVLTKTPDYLYNLSDDKVLAYFLDKNAELVLKQRSDILFDLLDRDETGKQILANFLDKRENAKLVLEYALNSLFDLPVFSQPLGATILTNFLDKHAELVLKIIPSRLFELSCRELEEQQILTNFLNKHAELVLKITPGPLFELSVGSSGATILTNFLERQGKLIAELNDWRIHEYLTPEFKEKYKIKLVDEELDVKDKEHLNPVIKSILSKIHIRDKMTAKEKDTLTKNLVLLLKKAIENPDILSLFRAFSNIPKPINIYKNFALKAPGTDGMATYETGIVLFKSESLLREFGKKPSSDFKMITWLSNLLHESTHMVLYNLYGNIWKPFSSSDKISQEKFAKIVNDLSQKKIPYHHYSKEHHTAELPAFLSNALLIQTMSKKQYEQEENEAYNLLLNHTSLGDYMKKVYRVADLDSESIEIVSAIFDAKANAGEHNITDITMGYLRGGYHHNNDENAKIDDSKAKSSSKKGTGPAK